MKVLALRFHRACVIVLTVVLTSFSIVSGTSADTDSGEGDWSIAAHNAEALLDDALMAFDRMLERKRFVQVMDSARAMVLFPSLLKAGYFVGGKSGSGVLVVRTSDGGWSHPAFVQIVGGGFGLQIGVSVSQVALLVQSEQALESLLDGNLELGGEFSVAIGPAAVDAGIDTNFDVLTYTLTEGAYAGLTLEGSSVVKSIKRNHAYYGAKLSTRDIVLRGMGTNDHVEQFREQLVLLTGDI